MALAGEVQAVLRSPQLAEFLPQLYGNTPDAWDEGLTGVERWRCIVNALTRLRFCSALGVMEFASKDSALAAPEGCMPWFEVPGRLSAGTPIAFGHWSTVGLGASDPTPRMRQNTLAMDTGCVWGGCLSALRLQTKGAHELIQVKCPQAQQPA